MNIKRGLEISTQDFWYDLTDGGYLVPRDICENIEDAKKVEEAIRVIEEFEKSCDKQISGFIQ